MSTTRRADHGIDIHDERLARFWAERHLVTLTTLRADGSPHVVPVGATLDADAGLVRVIASRTSAKVRHVARGRGDAPPGGPGRHAGSDRAAVCQVDGRYWATIEGRAEVRDAPADVAEAERRYAERYRTPRENPDRVVVAIHVTRVLGNLG